MVKAIKVAVVTVETASKASFDEGQEITMITTGTVVICLLSELNY